MIALSGDGWNVAAPAAIAADDLDRLYVLDQKSRAVFVFDRAGKGAQAVPGDVLSGEVRSPAFLAVDAEGRVYVADKRAGRVVRFQ